MSPKLGLPRDAGVDYPRWVIFDAEDRTRWGVVTGWLNQRQAKQVSRNVATALTRPVGLVMENRSNPTLAAHGLSRAATWHILSEDNEPLADLYYNLSKRPAAARVARLIANLIGSPVKLLDNAGTPPDLKAHPRSYVSNPAQVPQGGVYAYWRDHGRVWVESIHSLNGTAMIRPDPGIGMRGHVKKVALRDLDFGEVGSTGWKPLRTPNPKGRNHWTVRDASGRIFWNGKATDESEALFMAERSQAGKSDPAEPWTATRSNPSYRLTGTLEEIPDAPAVRRGPGRPRRVALAPVEPEAPPSAVAEIPFEVPGEAAPRRDFQPGEHVTVPYSGRSSYFGRKVRRTRERGIVEGYVRQGGETLVHVRVARGGQVEDHHFPERDVRRLPRSGQKVLSIRRPAVRARLERKVRGSLEAAEKMIAKLSAQFEAADARAHEIYPQFGQLPSKEYVNLRARMRRLREKLDVLGVLAGELGGGLAATGTDPWAANRRQSNPSWPTIDHSLLSPSGRMSKRARSAAMKREAARLFPPGYWDPPPQSAGDKAAAQAAVLLRTAAQLRELAARGMQPRKYVKAAERLERQAAEAVRRTPNQRRHKHGAIGGSRTVRGVNRKGNPRGSEYDRAVQTYRMWHEFEPHRITRMKGPDRLIPRTLVKLGEIRAIDYISDKYKGRPVTYTHKTDRPRPVLATDPDGRNLHIVGGRVQITADGLIH